MRTLIVGDIHGCFAEFMDLLAQAGLSGADRIIAVGDIVDRGPDSRRVLEFFRDTPQAVSIMGNHERKHIRSYRNEISPALSQRIVREQLAGDYEAFIAFMQTFSPYLDLPEALIVHGFFEPGIPIESQRDVVIIGTLTGDHHLRARYTRPWYELYDGEKPIVVGHRDYCPDYQPLVYRDRVFGIDTGCYRGGRLTGLLLPAFKLFSVPARADHWAHTRRMYGARYGYGASRARPAPKGRWESLAVLERRLADPGITPEERQEIAQRLAEQQSAERVLAPLYHHVMEEHKSVMAALLVDGTFAALSPREQGKRYAAHVRKHPLSVLLHLTRRGELDLDAVRRYFRTPVALLKFLDENGLRTRFQE